MSQPEINNEPDKTSLVSIVIPTYRRPNQVRHAVLSALAQTWSHIEVLVVSDGPDPETRAVLTDLLSDRLEYMELPENAGPAAARNAGILASHGEWLCFLDDDDLMLSTKVERQMALADAEVPSRMISCRAIYRHGGRDDVWPDRPIGENEDVAEYILKRPSLLGRPGVLSIQSLLIHRSLLKMIPFSTHKDHEDWAWLLEVWHLASARVTFAWAPLVVYCVDVDSLSRSRRVNWQDSLAWALRYRRWIGDRAFCSFLCTKAALKAKRGGDWTGLWTIAKAVLPSRPNPREIAFLLGIACMPSAVLQRAWRRSLHAVRTGSAEQARLATQSAESTF